MPEFMQHGGHWTHQSEQEENAQDHQEDVHAHKVDGKIEGVLRSALV